MKRSKQQARSAQGLVLGVLLALLALGGCTSAEFGLAPEPVRRFLCYQLMFPFSRDPTFNLGKAIDACTAAAPRSSPASAPLGPFAIAATRVTRAGETQVAQYLAEKRVTAGKFPRTVLELSPDAVHAARANSPIGRIDVLATMALMDANLELPRKRFDGFEARLLSVDARGRTELLATAEAAFTNREVYAEALFVGVEAEAGLRVVIQPTSGQLEPAIVLASAGVAGSPEAQDEEEEATATSGVWSTHRLEGATGDGEWIETAKGADFQSQTSMVVYSADKLVKVKKCPKVLIDLPSTSKVGKRPTISVGVNLLTDRFKVPNAKRRFNSIEATLFAIDAKGKRKKVASRKSKFDGDGVAAVTFRRVEEPKKGTFQVRLEMEGGKVKNSLVIATASASAE